MSTSVGPSISNVSLINRFYHLNLHASQNVRAGGITIPPSYRVWESGKHCNGSVTTVHPFWSTPWMRHIYDRKVICSQSWEPISILIMLTGLVGPVGGPYVDSDMHASLIPFAWMLDLYGTFFSSNRLISCENRPCTMKKDLVRPSWHKTIVLPSPLYTYYMFWLLTFISIWYGKKFSTYI